MHARNHSESGPLDFGQQGLDLMLLTGPERYNRLLLEFPELTDCAGMLVHPWVDDISGSLQQDGSCAQHLGSAL
jgi:hypothetical protein